MIRKLAKFNLKEWMDTINWLIDEVNRNRQRSAPGTLRGQTYKGSRRSAAGGVVQNQQITQQTIPVSRWQ